VRPDSDFCGEQGLYNGYDYPFDLSDLRPLGTKLANACLDYLNYDRLGICDVDKHLEGGGRELEGWLRDYGKTRRAQHRVRGVTLTRRNILRTASCCRFSESLSAPTLVELEVR
jgi:hypothetical protein